VDEYDDASTATSESHGEDDDLDFPPHSREPPQSAQPQSGVTEEDLSEPLPELSDQLDQSRLDEEEDTQAAVRKRVMAKLGRPMTLK
jgi:hypothetical protein